MIRKALLICSAASVFAFLAADPAVAQDVSANVAVGNVRQYDVTRYEWADYPQDYVYRYEVPELKRLYLIADPTH